MLKSSGTGLLPAVALYLCHRSDPATKSVCYFSFIPIFSYPGIPGVIFNGVPDFLYETEVLRLDKALWFSSDGQTLMYVTYNDTLVQQHKYPWYGLDLQEPPAYPTIRSLRYPKVRQKWYVCCQTVDFWLQKEASSCFNTLVSFIAVFL